MTSSTLIPNGSVAQSVAENAASASPVLSATDSVPPSQSVSNNPVCALPMNKLPYQKPHQVELLNLHAETEALLQQLQLLKHQKVGTVSEASMAIAK